MLKHVCPGCGRVIQIDEKYAGQMGRCTQCGAVFQAPQSAPGEDPEGSPESQYVAPESFGAYSRAAEERWTDPVKEKEGEMDLSDIPEDILEKHRELMRRQAIAKRHFMSRVWSGVGGAILVVALVVGGLMIGRTGKNAAEKAVEERNEAIENSEGAGPRPAEQEPPPPPRYISPLTQVFALVGEQYYHTEKCVVFVNAEGEKVTGQLGQAVASGYKPCPFCKPPELAAPPPAVAPENSPQAPPPPPPAQ